MAGRSNQRLALPEYLQIVAATNFKQRMRKTLEYFHADRLNYAVVGTPNRLEYDQGFFVKNGDGSADVKPIAHLYKTQVYAMANHLELPARSCGHPDHGHVQPAAGAGRVLFRAAVSRDGPGALGVEPFASGVASSRRRSECPSSAPPRSTRTSTTSGAPPSTCISHRC
jgi:hypothetical protein